MKVRNPDAEEHRRRVLCDLMTAMGEPVEANVRKIFEDAGMLVEFERARAELIRMGASPNDMNLWRAVIQGMSDKAQQNDAHKIMAGVGNRKMS